MSSFANSKGTNEYKEYMITKKNLPESHFREFEDLNFTSLGMGTYLGKPNIETDKLVENAVIESIENGINVIDTAINYRRQKSERAIGNALRKLEQSRFNKNQFFISSKIGYIPGDADRNLSPKEYIDEILINGGLVSKKEIINFNCMSIPYLEHQFNQSLKNLKVDSIDLLYLHNVAESQKSILGEQKFYEMMMRSFEFLESKRADNKLKFYGMATWDCFRVKEISPEYVDLSKITSLAQTAAEEMGKTKSGFKFIMLPFNLAMSEAATLKNQNGKTFFEKANELDIGVFTAVPLLQGRLLNHNKSKELKNKWNLKTTAQGIIQYVRSYGMPLIAPLIGQKQSQHVKENLELAKLPPQNLK
ncbi:MAG: aldo/keto reductase [Candidatus Lokiarchaeota archaeon]|nr:aldo/keto reductase [Candidatus Lokiarchaeota archaeon]MBD3202501.1 aldo/keto reductase [Candidatus Lokiarchaeota archaeon]